MLTIPQSKFIYKLILKKVYFQKFIQISLKDHYLRDLHIRKHDIVTVNIMGNANNPLDIKNAD